MEKLILVWILTALASVAHSAFGQDTVVTTAGAVKGIPQRGTTAFLGVPFAAPPIGNLRLRPPAAPVKWTGIRPADKFSPMCAQRSGVGPVGTLVGSEDCLYLNVWVPDGTIETSKLPVMVFIHGGGLIIGSANDPTLHGANLASRGNVIVVTVQYRLGNLGYLAHPALTAESTYGGSGNYGLMDQMAALQWVKGNVAKFGGDAGNVTLFGESGGGASTCALMASPLTRGLFARVIVESMDCPTGSRFTGETEGLVSAAFAGCTGTGPQAAACLRSRPVEALIQSSTYVMVSRYDYRRTTSQILVDGYTMPEPAREIVRKGKAQPVPMMIGNNSAEGLVFVPFFYNAETLRANIEKIYGKANADRMYAQYPVGLTGTLGQAATVFADHFFECPIRTLARNKAASQSSPVYRYLYNYVPTISGFPVLAGHSLELPFVFQNVADFKTEGLSPNDVRTEAVFLSYWTSFARTGNPNSGTMPLWPAYRPEADNFLTINPNPRMDAGRRTQQCDLFDAIRGEN